MRRPRRPGRRLRRGARGTASVILGVLIPAALAAPILSAGASPAGAVGLVRQPSSLVDPLDGTGTGPVSPGNIGEYPGAVVPFGMIEWSPDTSPDRTAGSGYAYRDTHISGFSLTHLSGTGCASYGDVGVLPVAGALPARPEQATETFSHAHETAHPGSYDVRLGPAGIDVSLAVTTRAGLGRFTFPGGSPEQVLFKVADSANPVTASSVQVVGGDEVTGQVTSGGFCGTGTPYTVYFMARFDRNFEHDGTFTGGGEYVTFAPNTSHDVEMQVGISFVSEAGAQANLAAEEPGWSLSTVEHRATTSWDRLLSRIAVGGGTASEQRSFYTALYHSLLDPSVISDDSGQYVGDDGHVHTTSRTEYSNFSEWDIYRSEIQLLSLVAPTQTSDMMQSLVDDAQQNGWLPKWAIPGGDESQMNGDSADPIIASAYAFGIRNFDVGAALQAMVKGATQDETGHGLEIERQYLDQFMTQGYVDAGSLDLTSSDYSIGGSVTLEYAIDDFAIGELAESLGSSELANQMMSRAQNWESLFDPATNSIEAKNPDGSFPAGQAFQRALFEPGGEEGFEEGNAVQYTWSVPQDLSGLAALMGGDKKAVSELDRFFTKLNAGRFAPYDWAGNEPSLWTPWEYDSFGDPSGTQAVVRKIVNTLYHDAPVDEPGNDDLGALSSWYVWAAMGLYPVTPGSATLSLASPLFPDVSVSLASGKRLVLSAPGASAATPYIHALTVSDPTPKLSKGPSASVVCGAGSAPSSNARSGAWTRPWLPGSVLTTGATLHFVLSGSPDRTWGTAVADSPPTPDQADPPLAIGYSVPSGGITTEAGTPSTLEIGFDSTYFPSVTWTAAASPGLTVSPSSGTLSVPPKTARDTCGAGRRPAPASVQVVGSAVGRGTITVTYQAPPGSVLSAGSVEASPVVVDVTVTPAG